ncbi:MAG: hypothetical protein HYS89_02475 [Candidatus Colwellbacteria bacterium]|nr:hypothetical protein [Candidatus Colwellbacteria bacterium]
MPINILLFIIGKFSKLNTPTFPEYFSTETKKQNPVELALTPASHTGQGRRGFEPGAERRTTGKKMGITITQTYHDSDTPHPAESLNQDQLNGELTEIDAGQT